MFCGTLCIGVRCADFWTLRDVTYSWNNDRTMILMVNGNARNIFNECMLSIWSEAEETL